MSKKFFENVNMNDYTQDLELDEETSEKICDLAKELNFGENCSLHKPSDDEDIMTLNFFDGTPEKKPVMKVKYDDVTNCILGKLKYSDKIQYIRLDNLSLIHNSVGFFDQPSAEEYLDLLKSVEMFGFIEPLLVIRDEEHDDYVVINGKSRYHVAEELFRRTKDEKYAAVPCIVLDSSTSDAMIQGIIIATNMQYRKISRETLMKAIFLLDEIYRSDNMFKSATSVSEAIAKQTGVSRPTVDTYLKLKSLSPLAMDLVAKRCINLNIARDLSYRDFEVQDRIIKGLKDNINDVTKVNELLEWSFKKEDITDEEWEKEIEETLDMVPRKTSFTITVDYQDVEEIMKDIIVKRKRFAFKYLSLKDNSLNKNYKVKYNRDDIEQYVKRGLVKQETYDRFRTGNFKEITKSLA